MNDALVQFLKGNKDICLAQSQSSTNMDFLLGTKWNVLPFWDW